jgi:hypothetical protein
LCRFSISEFQYTSFSIYNSECGWINGIIYTAYSKFHIFHWLQIRFFSNAHFARVNQVLVYCLQYLILVHVCLMGYLWVWKHHQTVFSCSRIKYWMVYLFETHYVTWMMTGGGFWKILSLWKIYTSFFDDFIQLDWNYHHRNVSLHKWIAFFRTRNIKRKDKTTRLRAIF